MKKGILGALALQMALMAPQAHAQSFEEIFGTIFGAVAGGAVCSQFGQGDERLVLTAACAVGGALLGGAIGREFSQQDQSAYLVGMDASLNGQVGSRNNWRGDQHQGYTEVVRTGYWARQTSVQCREIRSVVMDGYGNVVAQQVDTSCYQQDQWVLVQNTEVVYGGQPQRPQQPQQPQFPQYNDNNYGNSGYDNGYDADGWNNDGGNYNGGHNGNNNGNYNTSRELPARHFRTFMDALYNRSSDESRLTVLRDLRDYLRQNRLSLTNYQADEMVSTFQSRRARNQAREQLMQLTR